MSQQLILSRRRGWMATWGRMGAVAVAIVAQLGLYVWIVLALADSSPWVYAFSLLLSVVAVLWIVATPMPPEYKLAWVIPILLVPVLGGAFYLLYGARRFRGKDRQRLAIAQAEATKALTAGPALQIAGGRLPTDMARQTRYLTTAGSFPVCDATKMEYFALGDHAFPRMLADMEKAERYILFEYFIVAAGEMWDQMFDVMRRKAAQGVDVRVLYDDLGSHFVLPRDFHKKLHEAGIKVQAVNPLGVRLRLRYNNRNHRKILVIDGVVSYTGGINIADEYINAIVKFGHWKDTVVRLEGPATWSFVAMFLSVWSFVDETADYTDFMPVGDTRQDGDWGVVQPFDDSPFDNIPVGEEAYLGMINRARQYVDIFTPYLIIDARMLEGLKHAAMSGIRVRIVTPHIPDKKLVFEVTRAYYHPLVEAGVEIYEYTPGFMHAKQIVVDGRSGIIGTINFDYRSFFLHQECAVWLYESPVLKDMQDDFDATIAVSQRVTLEDCLAVPWWRHLARAILSTFAPLM
ncbi:cardiolipin synthase [Tessaracoccus caeni]|uniref:cardiolipin synthase n=1 Tax=Tessaracoccus caeni TaxID=3031239 RepID=UPI0023D9A4EA|nr:cardiolipin synthase [Tessaracoccus caeni]MDF1488118.1 cardiolipin synthase [Tessaracoccus caeni]